MLKSIVSVNTRQRLTDVVSNIFVYSIGVCILLGKQVVFWNIGLNDGLWSFFLATIIVGIGFILLTFSFAEMVSMLPFTGGCYGYVRCSLGPWWGYLVGCCEATKYIVFHALMVQQVAKIVYTSRDISSNWAPLLWLGTMALIVPVQVYGKKLFWAATFVLAVGVVAVFAMYLLEAGAAPGQKHLNVKAFDNDAGHFFEHLPLAVAFYAGIDAMRTCTDTQSNRTVPRDMVVCMCVAGALALSLVATASFLTASGTILSGLAFPLSEGFSEVLGVSSREAAWLSLPGALAGSFAFTYAFGRQLRSMAGSGLLPAFLSTAHAEQKVEVEAEGSQRAAVQGSRKEGSARGGQLLGSLKGSLKKVDTAIKHHVPKKPMAALLFGSCLSYCVLLIGHYSMPLFELHFLRMCVLLATVVYSSLLTAFFVFMLRYSNLDRAFRSPFGLIGASISLIVFLLIFICVCFIRPDERLYTLAAFAGLCFVFYLYYVLVAKKRQFFSKEEQEKFMKAYVVNSNTARKKTKKSGGVGAGSSTGILSGVFAVVPTWLKPQGSSDLLPNEASRANHSQFKSVAAAGNSAGGLKKSASQNSTVVPSGKSVGTNIKQHVQINAENVGHHSLSSTPLVSTIPGDLEALQRQVMDSSDHEQQHTRKPERVN